MMSFDNIRGITNLSVKIRKTLRKIIYTEVLL